MRPKKNRKNKLVFSKNGSKCKVVFTDGTETPYYSSKENVSLDIVHFHSKDKISIDEFLTMTDQISEAQCMPLSL